MIPECYVIYKQVSSHKEHKARSQKWKININYLHFCMRILTKKTLKYFWEE